MPSPSPGWRRPPGTPVSVCSPSRFRSAPRSRPIRARPPREAQKAGPSVPSVPSCLLPLHRRRERTIVSETLAPCARRYREGSVFHFRPMTQEDAEAVAGWHYPAPFSFYDWDSDPDDLAELLDPKLRAEDYVAVDDDDGRLVGYFQYKRPHRPSLEIGLGLHPDWTGRGLGQSFVEAGLEMRAGATRPMSSCSRSRPSTVGRSPSTSGSASYEAAPTCTGRADESGSSSRCVVLRPGRHVEETWGVPPARIERARAVYGNRCSIH